MIDNNEHQEDSNIGDDKLDDTVQLQKKDVIENVVNDEVETFTFLTKAHSTIDIRLAKSGDGERVTSRNLNLNMKQIKLLKRN